MTLVGKIMLIGLSGITSTTGVTLLVVNKDKLFETSITQDIKKDVQEKGEIVPQSKKPTAESLKTLSELTVNPLSQTNEKNTSEDRVETPNGDPVGAPSVDTVQDDISEERSPEGKDYSCKFDGTYEKDSNKKKIKDFLENLEFSARVNGIQILGEGKNGFKCAKDMDDGDLEGIFEYLSENQDVKSGLTSSGGREYEEDNVIALRKNEGNWTIFDENNSGEVLEPIKNS